MSSRLLLTLALTFVSMAINAQDDPEYRAEIGGGVALTAYQGDLNGSLTAKMQPTLSLMGRYKFNPRMALAFTVSKGKLKGSTDKVTTWLPNYQAARYEFDNDLWDIGLRYEYNFLAYGTGREYRGAKRFTPFITGGIGATAVSGTSPSEFTLNFPLGVGLKYKLSTRVNVALDWTMHFSLSDNLDGVVDPYGIESAGLFKNADSYSMLSLTISYDIWAKCLTCNKE